MKPQALWAMGSGKAELLPAELGEGILVKMLFSGISKGTERLVFEGRVPASQAKQMSCNAQEGEFSFPVKYGYSAVGEIVEGDLAGQKVFALHPHQDFFRLPESQLRLLPEAVPAERAVLAANMETALNIVWDSNVSAGDRVCIIGAGVVGSLVAYLISKMPGTEVTLVDVNPLRSQVAKDFGVLFSAPENAPLDCDVVIHASATAAGLNRGISSAGKEARIVEASWYGEGSQEIFLGGSFHDQRLSLISSQVGSIPPNRAPRWSFERRLSKAIELLVDPKLDCLISGETKFTDIAGEYRSILTSPNTLCHRIRY